jgi:hypothetical protein
MRSKKATSTTARLSEDAIRQRLASYKSPEVTNELYAFGKMMVDEVVDRFKSLDTKATAIAAYSIGLITILVSTRASWRSATHPLVGYAPLVSGAIAFASAAVAVSTLWLKGFAGISQDEWVKAECLDDAEKLRRYHIIVMHGVHESYRKLCKQKAFRVVVAEALLLASAIILLFALADTILPPIFPFGIAVGQLFVRVSGIALLTVVSLGFVFA